MAAGCGAIGVDGKSNALFAWLHNYRRIVVRWEHYPENFLGLFHLASAIILLRHL